MVGVGSGERADAARNREKILSAAERLFAEQGSDRVSMEAVAEAAGVGKGTVYRRFGDRATLARTLMDHRERRFQDQCIRGEPPLGPGAPAAERLAAFGEALLELIEDHADLLLAIETAAPGGRHSSPVYAFYLAHVMLLVRELNPRLDTEYTAGVLLAALGAEQVHVWRDQQAMSRERIATGYRALVRELSAGPG
ncbi:MAG: TetR/AcrR family transcriptional regulator [Actinomycetota bacterium]|nr:TetR/AcrR family transcriptional regulator [Actinomycetota bacterium]MDQ3647964.1 TetR/AcrR family transcriptional regulator [Actinomycetota bacterium]